VREYVDYASSAKIYPTNYKKLFNDVRKRRADVMLVWKFNWFSSSTKEIINALQEFKILGVDLVSYKENWDTNTPTCKILFTIISSFAEFEGAIITERVIAGVEKAKTKGIRIGSPGFHFLLSKKFLKWKIRKLVIKRLLINLSFKNLLTTIF